MTTTATTEVANLRQSRTGKRTIDVPKGVSITIKDGKIEVKGPKGSSSRKLMPNVDVKIEGATASVTRRCCNSSALAIAPK
jgi:ribosomal protein L6P/L9E